MLHRALLDQEGGCIKKALVFDNLAVLEPPTESHFQIQGSRLAALVFWVEGKTDIKMPPHDIAARKDFFGSEMVKGVIHRDF